MRKIFLAWVAVTVVAAAAPVLAQNQKDADEGPSSSMNFLVLKDDNGKPVRNAAVIMHPVNPKGKQERGGLELKTDTDGKASFEGIPYGMLRVQVLAQGFQTYGEDFDIEQPKTEITIKLKRPQSQYSIYDDHPKDPNAAPKQDPPPANKPN
jgi:hypothetical protein